MRPRVQVDERRENPSVDGEPERTYDDERREAPQRDVRAYVACIGRIACRHALSADGELKTYVLADLRGSRIDAAPAHESQSEPVLSGADLGIDSAVRRQ
jgi:hypothetical protein